MTRRLQAEKLEERDCPAAGSAVVQIAAGAGYTLSVNTYGRFAVMQVSQAEYDLYATSSQAAADDITITQRIYQTLPDVFDQIIVTTTEPTPTTGLNGYNRPVLNNVRGIGQPVYDNSTVFGSGGNLESFIYFAAKDRIRTATSLHEILHRWANFLPELNSNTVAHWGFSSVGGQLGGWAPGTLRQIGPNTYDADGPTGNTAWYPNSTFSNANMYSPLELYVMGMIPAEEVPPIQVAVNGAYTNQALGQFTADGFTTVTIQDIVQGQGQRLPTWYDTKRNYRALPVVITPDRLTQAEIDEFDTNWELFGRGGSDGDPTVFNFWEATGGRASIQVSGLNQFLPTNSSLLNSFLSVGGDNNRVTGYSTITASGYDTNRQVVPRLAEFLGDSTVEVRTAMADVNGDTIPDFVVSNGAGPITRFGVYNGVLNGGWIITPTEPFRGSEDFTGGAYVSAGDLDGDGFAEMVVTADTGGGPRVVLFTYRTGDGLSVAADFLGINDPNFRGGARTAIGDVNADGLPDLAVVAGTGGGPRVSLYNGASLTTTRTKLVSDFFAFPGIDATRLRNGAFVTSGDLNGDGYSDLIFGGGPGGAPRVLALSGFRLVNNTIALTQANPLANFYAAGNTDDRGGVRLATKNVDGDTRADLVLGSGNNTQSRVRIYRGVNFPAIGEPTLLQDINPFLSTLPGGVYVG